MKKLIALLTAAVLLFACCLTASAAVPSYTAKKNTPTIDGVVNSGEYGTAVPFNKSNVSLFYYNSWDTDPTGANSNPPDATFQFAWDKDALYVGITATNLQDVTDGKWQIDLSPDKKIKDGKAGIFYTITVTALGTDGIIGIARDNYQTEGNTGKTSMNINRYGAMGVATEVSAGVVNIEVKIPLSEMQVSGSGGDFTKLSLKDNAKWGVGCYFIGNGGGFTSTQGAGNDADGLVQIYNDFTLLGEGGQSDSNTGNNTSSTGSTGSTDKNTSSAGKTDSTDKTSSVADSSVSDSDTVSDGDSASGEDTASDSDTASSADGDSDASDDTDKDTEEKSTDADTAESKGVDTALIIAIVGAAVVIAIALVSSVIIIVKSGSGKSAK